MVYYKFDDKEIIKYRVKYNLLALNSIKSRIIANCGALKHRSYDTDYLCSMNDEYTFNYKYEKIGTIEYFEEERDYYHVEYDEIVVPELVKLIDDLLCGGMDIVPYLLGDKVLDDGELDDSLKKEIAEREYLLNELNSAEYKAYDEMIKLCKEIKEISGRISGTSGKEKQSNFLPSLRTAISLTELARLDMGTYNKYNEFFEVEEKPFVKQKTLDN